MSAPSTPDVYTDFTAFTRMRADARAGGDKAVSAVAEQFEALFIQMMLKSMREAGGKDELFDSSQSDFYRDLHDQQLALTLAKGQGIGLKDLIARQLAGQAGTTGGDSPSAGNAKSHGADPAIAGAKNFVNTLLPHAREAGAALGVAPEALLAQAALETGWGRSLPLTADGGSSHNLFGIKAGANWNGAQATVPTMEVVAGAPVRTSAAFRAYDSYGASFADYVRFVQDNPRYREALNQAGDPAAWFSSLQQAGYATDPAYADKLKTLLGGETLTTALKESGTGPLTG